MSAVLALSGCASSGHRTMRAPAGPDFAEAHPRTTEPAPLAVSNGRRPILPDDQLFFAFDSDRLDRDGQTLLGEVAAWVLADPRREIVVEGHADQAGDRDYNLDLSQRRARAVADHLLSIGVPRHRVVILAKGETQAVIEPQMGNRRVVIFGSLNGLSTPVRVSRRTP